MPLPLLMPSQLAAGFCGDVYCEETVKGTAAPVEVPRVSVREPVDEGATLMAMGLTSAVNRGATVPDEILSTTGLFTGVRPADEIVTFAA